MTFHLWSGSTMFSSSVCSTTIYLLPPASCHLNRSRPLLTTLTNWKLTESSPLSEATEIFITSYSGLDTVTYSLSGNLRAISGMRKNWLMSFTESIRGSLNNDWTCSSGIGRFLQGFIFLWFSNGFWASINGIGIGFTTYHRHSSLPVHRIRCEAAYRVLIGCGTCQVMRRCTH